MVEEDLTIWDNTNIKENYSGMLLPLTCSFLRDIYYQAYFDVARKNGVSTKKLEKNEHIFKNLIGFFYGRPYYNLTNWYNMLVFYPNYEKNIENLNKMLGLKEPPKNILKPTISLLFKIRYYLRLAIKYISFDNKINQFMNEVEGAYKKFLNINLKSKTEKQLIQYYFDIKDTFLRRWWITIENDFLVSYHFGKFKGDLKQIRNIKRKYDEHYKERFPGELKLESLPEFNNQLNAKEHKKFYADITEDSNIKKLKKYLKNNTFIAFL
ncbi:MAG: hypothetical protein AABY22_35765, partial [Nanoarchaeota archaeon]